MKHDNYSIIHEQEDIVDALRRGNGIVRVELWMPDDYIGKMLRKKLEQASGAAVTVTYEVITEEMQQAAQAF